MRSLNLRITHGEKIAICGPSGSGKTSLILALLKMIDLKEGSILIDGTNVGLLNGEEIRSHINVIPQEPYFLPGNLRNNLDPNGRVSDDIIKNSIRKVGLWEKVNARGGLNPHFMASDWSHGERQLLCLARAALMPSKIVLLDEAMSRYVTLAFIYIAAATGFDLTSLGSVDPQTESIMQKVIDTEFGDRTVISIIHQYTYIDRFDRIAVLQNGKLIECDKPSILLRRNGSVFRHLYNTTTGSTVQNYSN